MQGRLIIPGLSIATDIDLLVDTGADCSCLHPTDGMRVRVPYGNLSNPLSIGGIGGNHNFFREPAALIFADGKRMRVHAIWLAIATPTPQNMRHPSLLGQDVLKNWRMTHEPHIARLEFIVKNADLTFNI